MRYRIYRMVVDTRVTLVGSDFVDIAKFDGELVVFFGNSSCHFKNLHVFGVKTP